MRNYQGPKGKGTKVGTEATYIYEKDAPEIALKSELRE